MKYRINKFLHQIGLIGALTLAISSCKKDGNPNNLPNVNPADYEGTIDGFSTSDEIYPDNLVAYWPFDNNKNEIKTGTAPTSSAGDNIISAGVKGSALSLNSGFLYYAKQFGAFKTDSLKSWSISVWVKIKNNGSKKTMLFQLARPDFHWGNINVYFNTDGYPASNDSVIRLNPRFATLNATVKTTSTAGLQDNLNNQIDKFNLNEWLHVVLTYDISTGVFNSWINSIKASNFSNRGTNPTTQLFNSWEPNEVIIGSNYNGIPGKSLNSDAAFAPMTGQVDELRVYNITLPDAFIKALYNLGKAGK